MSASPPPAAVHSTKRPLEDPSSPSGPTDQPDAKRPALDKMVKAGSSEEIAPTADETATPPAAKTEESDNDVKPEPKDEEGDTVVSDAPREGTQPIETTASSSRGNNGGMQHDETGWLHIRAVISSAEAATVIGKGGENVALIRRLSAAKLTVSDYSRGAVERILTVSGVVDAVAKVKFQTTICLGVPSN